MFGENGMVFETINDALSIDGMCIEPEDFENLKYSDLIEDYYQICSFKKFTTYEIELITGDMIQVGVYNS